MGSGVSSPLPARLDRAATRAVAKHLFSEAAFAAAAGGDGTITAQQLLAAARAHKQEHLPHLFGNGNGAGGGGGVDSVSSSSIPSAAKPIAAPSSPTRRRRRSFDAAVADEDSDLPPLTFGVEYELGVPKSVGSGRDVAKALLAATGLPVHFLGYTHRTTSCWKLVTDGSLKFGSDYEPFEVVSPILKGSAGLDQVRCMLRALEGLGCVVNLTTGHHVHIGAATPDFTFRSLQCLAACYIKYEKAFDLCMPRSRQLDSNQYIHSNQQHAAEEQGGGPFRAILAIARTTDLQQLVDVVNPSEFSFTNQRRFPPGTAQYLQTLNKQRYYKLNFTNLLIVRPGNDEPLGTVEFRHHSGTVTAERSVQWIRLLLRFVAHCRDRQDLPRPLHADRTPAETFLIMFRDAVRSEALLAFWWARVEALDRKQAQAVHAATNVAIRRGNSRINNPHQGGDGDVGGGGPRQNRLVRAMTMELLLGYDAIRTKLREEDLGDGEGCSDGGSSTGSFGGGDGVRGGDGDGGRSGGSRISLALKPPSSPSSPFGSLSQTGSFPTQPSPSFDHPLSFAAAGGANNLSPGETPVALAASMCCGTVIELRGAMAESADVSPFTAASPLPARAAPAALSSAPLAPLLALSPLVVDPLAHLRAHALASAARANGAQGSGGENGEDSPFGVNIDVDGRGNHPGLWSSAEPAAASSSSPLASSLTALSPAIGHSHQYDLEHHMHASVPHRQRRHEVHSPSHLIRKAEDFVPSWERSAAGGGRRHSYSGALGRVHQAIDDAADLIAASAALHASEATRRDRAAAELAQLSPGGGAEGRALFAARLAQVDAAREAARLGSAAATAPTTVSATATMSLAAGSAGHLTSHFSAPTHLGAAPLSTQQVVGDAQRATMVAAPRTSATQATASAPVAVVATAAPLTSADLRSRSLSSSSGSSLSAGSTLSAARHHASSSAAVYTANQTPAPTAAAASAAASAATAATALATAAAAAAIAATVTAATAAAAAAAAPAPASPAVAPMANFTEFSAGRHTLSSAAKAAPSSDAGALSAAAPSAPALTLALTSVPAPSIKPPDNVSAGVAAPTATAKPTAGARSQAPKAPAQASAQAALSPASAPGLAKRLGVGPAADAPNAAKQHPPPSASGKRSPETKTKPKAGSVTAPVLYMV